MGLVIPSPFSNNDTDSPFATVDLDNSSTAHLPVDPTAEEEEEARFVVSSFIWKSVLICDSTVGLVLIYRFLPFHRLRLSTVRHIPFPDYSTSDHQ